MITVRISFEKKNEASYISLLDLQRVMQRVLKRSGLPLAGSGANQNESPKTDNPNNSYKDEAPEESLVGETRF